MMVNERVVDMSPRCNTPRHPHHLLCWQRSPRHHESQLLMTIRSSSRDWGRLLRSAGFDVDTYGSGPAFLNAGGDEEPDCVVLAGRNKK